MNAPIFAGIVVFALSTGLVACRSPNPQAKSEPRDQPARACPVPGIQTVCGTVWVTSTGDVELNGRPADLAHVEAAFQKLTKEGGVVVYGRASGQGDPHPTALKVIELVVKYQLNVSMSTQRDFSDVVGPDGRPRPRTTGPR